jgi:hypothetical protein
MFLTPETPLPSRSVAGSLRPLPMLIFSSRWLDRISSDSLHPADAEVEH